LPSVNIVVLVVVLVITS